MHVCFSAYGDRFVPYLEVALSSFLSSNPEVTPIVSLGGVSKVNRACLTYRFPQTRFLDSEKTLPPEGLDSTRSIAFKVGHWEALLSELPNDEIVAFLDVDTLTRQAIRPLLPENFDLAFTYKEERWPLNTGVVFVRNTARSRLFVREWSSTSAELAKGTRPEIETANRVAGGIDQYTFLQLINGGIDANRKHASRLTPGPYFAFERAGKAKLVGLPCSIFNETNSVSLSSPAAILHYKGWMSLVIDNDGEFNKFRSEETSSEIYNLWESSYKATTLETLGTLIARFDADDQKDADGANSPSLIQTSTGREVAISSGLARDLGVPFVCVLECANQFQSRRKTSKFIARIISEDHSTEAADGIADALAQPRVMTWKSLNRFVRGEDGRVGFVVLNFDRSRDAGLIQRIIRDWSAAFVIIAENSDDSSIERTSRIRHREFEFDREIVLGATTGRLILPTWRDNRRLTRQRALPRAVRFALRFLKFSPRLMRFAPLRRLL